MLLCGGTNLLANSNECLALDFSNGNNGEWNSYAAMNERRVFAASAVIGDTLYVTGGFSDQFGTELYSVESTTLESG